MTELTGRLVDGQPVRLDITDGRLTRLVGLDRTDGDNYVAQSTGEDLLWVLPGLVDLQVNGFAGYDANSAELDVDVVISLVRAMWSEGVTAFCPTLITAPEEQITRALAVIARARATDPLVAASIPGVHVEGPGLSPIDGPRGAHSTAHVRPPDLAEFGRWQRAGQGLVRLVTLAPEYPGALAYIRALAGAGTVVAVGHTAASPDRIRAAAAAGARVSTHLGNGAHAVLPRHPNYLWAQLADDRLTATFIADGHHLPLDTFTAMVRAKSAARSVLVSDAVALAGRPPGTYRTPVGGDVTVGADGTLRLTGSQSLAGSGRSLSQCLRWAVCQAGISLADATSMSADNPARLLGLGHRRAGPGDASAVNLTVLSSDLSVAATVVAGSVVFDRRGDCVGSTGRPSDPVIG